MNLADYLTTHGSQTELARIVGAQPQLVWQWSRGRRKVPIERCVSIERATNGAVTRKDLRPDDWHEIWPELAGGFEGLLRAGLERAETALDANPGDRLAQLVHANRTQALDDLTTPTEPAAAGM